MLLHDLTLTLRSLARRKGYALLHVLGLAAGLAACLVVLLYAAHELTYDRFHPDAEQIYSIKRAVPFGPRLFTMNGASAQGYAALSEGVAGVESIVQVEGEGGTMRIGDEDPMDVRYFKRVTPGFFDFFAFDLIDGRAGDVLTKPGDVVLTQSTARHLFGDRDPIGRSVAFLKRNFMHRLDTEVLTVTGIAADPPGNSSLRFQALAYRSPNPNGDAPYDMMGATPTYVRLGAPVDTAAVLTALRSVETPPDDGPSPQISVARFIDGRLGGMENVVESRLRYVYLFGVVALLLLVVAVINYVNLATAYASERRREVGVRKTLGSSRGEVRRLFWLEALLLSLAAGLLALVLSLGARPFFEAFFGFDLAITPLTHPWTGAILIGAALLSGALAGLYPALYLARQQPVAALSGHAVRSGWRTRRALVALQFALAVGLLSATWIVGDQLELGRANLLGDREQTLVLPVDTEEEPDVVRLQQAIAVSPAVNAIVRSNAAPGQSGMAIPRKPSVIRGEEEVEGEEGVPLLMIASDASFSEFYNLDVIAGRPLRPDEQGAIVLSETAVRQLGYGDTPETALGRSLTYMSITGEIVGVVADFRLGSIGREVRPTGLAAFPPDAGERGSIFNPRALSIRTAPGESGAALTAIQSAWREVLPDTPFTYKWLDDVFAESYEAERRTQAVFGFAATLALVLACMGLFGLAAFAAMQRRKEIGVRKALGAGVARLIGLMTRDFALLVLVGFALAVPAAYVLMGRWLEGFAERAPMRPGVFLGAGAVVLVVALATVGWHALRAATVNPADVLRDE